MNADNCCVLQGTILSDSWTRWRSPAKGVAQGQVRFWLIVPREGASAGGRWLEHADRLLCAIEPASAVEVARLERELLDGRQIRIEARAQSCVLSGLDVSAAAAEASPGVIFVAESVALEGSPAAGAHQVGAAPRPAARGKMAAAGDELPLQGTEGAP